MKTDELTARPHLHRAGSWSTPPREMNRLVKPSAQSFDGAMSLPAAARCPSLDEARSARSSAASCLPTDALAPVARRVTAGLAAAGGAGVGLVDGLWRGPRDGITTGVAVAYEQDDDDHVAVKACGLGCLGGVVGLICGPVQQALHLGRRAYDRAR